MTHREAIETAEDRRLPLSYRIDALRHLAEHAPSRVTRESARDHLYRLDPCIRITFTAAEARELYTHLRHLRHEGRELRRLDCDLTRELRRYDCDITDDTPPELFWTRERCEALLIEWNRITVPLPIIELRLAARLDELCKNRDRDLAWA